MTHAARLGTVLVTTLLGACAEAGTGPEDGGGGSGGSTGVETGATTGSTGTTSSAGTTATTTTVSSSTSTTVSTTSSSSTGGGGAGGGAECGDGVVEQAFGEDCDFDSQGDPLVSATCASLGFPSSGANPGCSMDCKYDIKVCLCGDAALDVLEDCDGSLFGPHTCQTEGFAGGTLTCTPDCTLDTSGCNGCGNGTVEAGEQCDDGNTMPGDGCSATCQTEVVACDPDGTYVIQGAPFSYTCCLGLVSINVGSFVFSQDGASIGSSPSNPVAMSGAATTCPSGSFSNSGSIAGGCTETYVLNGTFLDADTWSGTYEVQFTGPDCSCFGGMFGTPCVNQLFSVTAMR